MTVQTQPIQYIPLNKLVASSRNVRRKDRRVDIDALAASIAAKGLLQNLCVVPGEGDKFEVDAGGRRLLALKLLARTGAIAKDFAVPCNVIAREAGREASLAENVHRAATDAMDEVDAYAKLIEEGATSDEVARRFGVERRHVDQRLALATLSPKIKAAWKRGDVSLDAARAFCLVDDHAKQDAVFRSLGRPVTSAASVRSRLMENGMRASDRLALYVGLDAYAEAGGAVVRDLFDADAVYVGDPALMAKLAEDKLRLEGAPWLAQGWGWVDVTLGQGRPEGVSTLRLQPEARAYTDDEEVELSRLRTEIDALDEALELDSVEDDMRWDTRDELSAAIETLRQTARVWNPDLIGHAGVFLSLTHDAEVIATPGVIRQADEKTVRAIRKAKELASTPREAASPEGEADASVPGNNDVSSSLPKAVIRDLSMARTRALRLLIARDRDIALAVTVASMITRNVLRGDLSGVGVAAHPANVDDLDELTETRGALLAHVPEEESDVLLWCLAQPSGTLMALLALLVAGSIDLTHERGAPSDRRRQLTADVLAGALDLDMRDFWKDDPAYWARLPKPELLSALADSPNLIELSQPAREASLKAHAKLKKDELAVQVGRAFDGSRYLPDLLVTPIRKGGLVLNEPVAAAVAAE